MKHVYVSYTELEYPVYQFIGEEKGQQETLVREPSKLVA